MKKSITTLSAIALALCLSANAKSQSFTMNFKNGVSSWQTVLDGVMGGRSSGRVRETRDGNLSFAGKLSLENNGGFSQMRTPVSGETLTGAKGLVMEVRGDGRTYNFDIRVSNARMMAGGFQRSFKTVADQWVEVQLPFDGFELQSFGRRISKAPKLNPTLIESIGVTLSDKKAGDFRLEIRSIKALGASDSKSANAADAASKNGNDLVSVAKSAGLTTLLELVTLADLKLPKTPVTIFAPTNEAFAAIPAATLQQLLLPESRATLRQILTHHIVSGVQSSGNVLNSRSLSALSNQSLSIDADNGKVAGASIVAVDVPFNGGIVHVIDTVMLPESRSISEIVSTEGQLSTLIKAASSANLLSRLERQSGSWTVFTPVNSAFDKLPPGTVESLLEQGNVRTLTQVLGLHVVPGRVEARDLLAKKSLTTLTGTPLAVTLKNGKLTLGANARIIASDIQASNGIIHIIDEVLLPASREPVASNNRTTTNTETGTDIVEEFASVYALAVKFGTPLFNDGNPEACAAVYEVAVETMIRFGRDELGNDVIERLMRTRQEGEAANARSRAWALRRALDDSYNMLLSAPRQRETLQRRDRSAR